MADCPTCREASDANLLLTFPNIKGPIFYRALALLDTRPDLSAYDLGRALNASDAQAGLLNRIEGNDIG
jgi:hypothetical protein